MGEQNIEHREGLKPLLYEVHINREAIEKAEDLPAEMKEWLSRLPEVLAFTEPITLIVGENGSGKSSFSKAIIDARLRSFQEHNPDARASTTLRLDPKEPAAILSQYLTIHEAHEQGAFSGEYIDGAEVMHEVREWVKTQVGLDPKKSGAELSGGTYTHRLSSRQLFNQAIRDLSAQMSRNRVRYPQQDVVFDEPEQGLSPHGQLELTTTLTSFVKAGDTMMVPTNNLALYLSELPRLDLQTPERGIFRPEDFGEHGEIRLAHKES